MRWETEARALRRLGLRRGACGRRHRLFIGAGEPRFACGSEAGVAARPFPKRPELGDDSGSHLRGPPVSGRERGRALRCGCWAARCCWAGGAAVGPRGRAGGKGGRPRALALFLSLFFYSKGFKPNFQHLYKPKFDLLIWVILRIVFSAAFENKAFFNNIFLNYFSTQI